MMKPYLSIIVPVYNAEKHLNKCIRSILEQEYRNFELILVDDGSTDTSMEICVQYSLQDERIHVIHKKNRGVMSARKTGFLYSCGRYISFIDSDDWIEPKFYNGLAEIKELEYDIILMNGYRIDGAKNKQVRTVLKQGVYYKREVERLMAGGGIIPSLWSKLFKRELIRDNILLIDNRVWRGEDMLLSYTCLLDANTVMVRKSYQYHYVQHEASAMHQYSSRNIENLRFFANNVKKIQNLKGSGFLDTVWDRHILMELLDIIRKEFYRRNFLLSSKELRELDRKFSQIRISHLLLGESLKILTGANKWIVRLYSMRLFQLLNLYLKYVDNFIYQNK